MALRGAAGLIVKTVLVYSSLDLELDCGESANRRPPFERGRVKNEGAQY